MYRNYLGDPNRPHGYSHDTVKPFTFCNSAHDKHEMARDKWAPTLLGKGMQALGPQELCTLSQLFALCLVQARSQEHHGAFLINGGSHWNLCKDAHQHHIAHTTLRTHVISVSHIYLC